MRMFAVFFALLSVSVYMLLVGVPLISQWEVHRGFPYGRMCDLDNSCPIHFAPACHEHDGSFHCH